MLREPEHVGDVLGAAGMDDGVGEAVDNLAAVGPVAGARGPIGSKEHTSSVGTPGAPGLCRTAQGRFTAGVLPGHLSRATGHVIRLAGRAISHEQPVQNIGRPATTKDGGLETKNASDGRQKS